jgi:3-dehydroquinate synthetase
VARHLESVGLPSSLEEVGIADGPALVPQMLKDKKVEGGCLRLILTRGIGEAFVDSSVTPAELASFLAAESA